MNKLMTTTALVLMMGSASSMAEQHTSGGAFSDYQVQEQSDLFASDLLGARIYATETEVGDTIEDGAEQEWDDLGEINDMILNSDGTVQVVILGIGGFLGIGERNVAVDMDQIKLVRDGADPTEYFLVVNASQEAIEGAPEFTRSEGDMAEGDAAEEDAEQAAEAAAEETEEAAENAANEAEQAAEETEQAAENAANEVDQAAEETEQAAENAAQETEQAAEDAANAVDQAAEDAANEAEQAVDEATDGAETQN